MTVPVCPCDGEPVAFPSNLPGLSSIAYRAGTYVSFRRAVLTPLFTPAAPSPLPVERTLSVDGVPVWRTDGSGDLAVMIAEWFAYIADIITFYNERTANQAYLRTADLPESVKNLIGLLGYRPRPGIGAVGSLAALLTPGAGFGGQPIVLPPGLQFQSKPTPGHPPQTFELSAATTIGAPDQLPAAPAPNLLGTIHEPPVYHYSPYHSPFYAKKFGFGSTLVAVAGRHSLLLQGSVSTIGAGDLLRLRARAASAGGPWLASVVSATISPAPSGGGQRTRLVIRFTDGAPADGLTAAQASLESAQQSASLWTVFAGAISSDGRTVHLASLARQIAAGDWLLFTAGSGSPGPELVQVASTADVIWDANATGPSTPPFTATTSSSTNKADPPVTTASATTPIPMPHTQLTLATPLPGGWSSATGVSVRFGWAPVGTLLDQPPAGWAGAPTDVIGTGGRNFPVWSSQPILLQDATGSGIAATGSSAGDGNLALGSLPDPVPSLQPPFLVLPNLLAVTAGRTVANEVLGSGDATNSGQDFKLSQSPVTYLSQGAGYASTITLTVDRLPWTEVASFFGQPPDATVFVTREDTEGKTHVMFGDGVNGARLPTGVNNVVATYRVGSGAASPPAGKLTVIGKSYPGLRAVLNPVAVGGGSDPDLPSQIQRNAPRSVLTFGRAVSVFDYQALAAQVPGVSRVGVAWGWNDALQRSLVTVYVGDDSGAATAAKKALASAGDPNRPVRVVQATQVPVALTLTLLVRPGMDTTLIAAAVAAALTDTESGLFGSWNMAIGQSVFDSQIETAVLGVAGAVAITVLDFTANGSAEAGPLHNPGEGGFYTLDPADINLTMGPDPNGR